MLNLFSGGKGELYSFSMPWSIPKISLYIKVGFKVPLITNPAYTPLKISLVTMAGSRQLYCKIVLGPYLVSLSDNILVKPSSVPFQASRKPARPPK